MNKYFYLLLLVLPFQLNAQINKDSLFNVWEDASQADTNRLKALHVIAWDGYILFSQPDSAFFFAQLEYELAAKTNDKKFMSDALNIQGTSFWMEGNYAKAIAYYTQCLKLYEEMGNKIGVATSLNNIGLIYKDQGDDIKAIEYFSEGLKIFEEIGNKRGMANPLNNLGLVYMESGNCDKAIDYFNQSIQISEELGNIQRVGGTLNNIGLIYQNQGDSAYMTGNKEVGDKSYNKAIDYFAQSLKIKEEIDDKLGLTITLNNIGMIYYHQDKYTQALQYSEKALEIAKEISVPLEIQHAAETLWQINKKLGKHQKALDMYELYIETRDTLLSEENQRAVIQQEYQYNYEKQHMSDSLAFVQQQELEEVEHQAELEKEAQQRYALYGGLGFLLLLGGVAFRGYTRKKKDNQLISAQKKEVEAAHQELESTHEQLEESHQEIKDSINYAERIQRSFLAGSDLLDQYLKDYFVFFQPKDVVSGDFYWASVLQNGNFALCCADSTGHGVPGAIMSLLNTSSLEKAIENQTDPHHILDTTRKIIIDRLKKDGSAEGGKDGMDCSLLVFNPDKTKMTFALAHNPMFIIRNGELIEFKGDKMPVGKHDKQDDPFTLQEVDLQMGDVIYTLTDGFPDQFGGVKGKKYMIKNFKAKLLEIAPLPMEEQKQLLLEEFSNWKGENEQVDDVCVVGLRV
ncbi:MAG: tetratricopeptide repeat protein [Crocinitomicaceae bacterium]